MDRNSVIGFSLLVLLLIGYIYYNQYNKAQYEEQKVADSIAHAKAHPKPEAKEVAETAAVQPEEEDILNDSARAALAPAFKGEEEKVVLENKDLKLEFTTRGAFPVSALLKQYKTYEQEPLYLFDGKNNKFSAILPVNDGATATSDLYYTVEKKQTEEGYQSLVFTADMGDGKEVHFTYTLPEKGYMLQTDLHLEGMSTNSLEATWQTEALHTEKDLKNERRNSQIYYRFTDKDDDYFTIDEKDETKTFDDPVKWVGFRLHFFATALVSEKGLNRVKVVGNTEIEDSSIVATNTNTFDLPLENKSAHYKLYIGPNHYNTLRSFDIGLEEMVPLGYGPMFFVKYINKGLIIPIFNMLSKFISNYGIIIMLMTIIIRLLLSFFTYKSYLSAAKMRVLKPEIDELRAQYKDDQQKFGMEQMKLYRQAGVNPLGGCLPTLFQLPILFAMFYFFPSSIELRQESFLWANDLSTYDSIASWNAQIPILSSIYGNHISLFTILMTVSSLFLALYNRNMTAQDPNNPMLKYLPFIFPFMLLGVFNKMAAALTFYYFFSNLISIAQQFIIQKYVINEDAIHAKIQEKKNQPTQKSKWQERLEQMQQTQMEKAKQQPRKKK